MGNRHTVAEAGGAQALAGKQVVGDGGARNGVLVLEQQAGMLERSLLARGVDVDEDVAGWQDGGETVHRRLRAAASAWWAAPNAGVKRKHQIIKMTIEPSAKWHPGRRVIVHGLLRCSNDFGRRCGAIVRYVAKSGPQAAPVLRHRVELTSA
jgi:hypothetical protein